MTPMNILAWSVIAELGAGEFLKRQQEQFDGESV